MTGIPLFTASVPCEPEPPRAPTTNVHFNDDLRAKVRILGRAIAKKEEEKREKRLSNLVKHLAGSVFKSEFSQKNANNRKLWTEFS